MVALILSDVHGNQDMLESILSRHPQASLLFVAGDITNFSTAYPARRILESLEIWQGEGGPEPRSAFIVPGNCDTPAARGVFQKSSFYVESQIQSFAAGYCGSFDALIGSSERRKGLFVVMTHEPPFGTAADIKAGRHVGNKDYADFLKRERPDIWICGHIHESRSVSRSGSTLVINPGPATLGCYAELNFVEKQADWTVSSALLRKL